MIVYNMSVACDRASSFLISELTVVTFTIWVTMLCYCSLYAGSNKRLATGFAALQADKDQLDVCIAQLINHIKATDTSHMTTKVRI